MSLGFCEKYMNWDSVLSENFEVPRDSYACDRHTFVLFYRLWQRLNDPVKALGRPFPRSRYFAPTLVVLWNLIKQGADLTNRFTRNALAPMDQAVPSRYFIL